MPIGNVSKMVKTALLNTVCYPSEGIIGRAHQRVANQAFGEITQLLDKVAGEANLMGVLTRSAMQDSVDE